MKTRSFIIGLFFIFFLCATTVYAQEGGSFSSYLVGTYDMRGGSTLLHIINPTAKGFEVYIAFFDADEKPLICKKDKLSNNDLLEIDVKTLKLDAKFGVVKIVSLRDKKPVPGIVGFQRHLFEKGGVTESNLASVPAKILEAELKIILDVCK
jgi:hypothetical protein